MDEHGQVYFDDEDRIPAEDAARFLEATRVRSEKELRRDVERLRADLDLRRLLKEEPNG